MATPKPPESMPSNAGGHTQYSYVDGSVGDMGGGSQERGMPIHDSISPSRGGGEDFYSGPEMVVSAMGDRIAKQMHYQGEAATIMHTGPDPEFQSPPGAHSHFPDTSKSSSADVPLDHVRRLHSKRP